MRIDELREALHEHGAGVEGHAPTVRVQEVHGRIRSARRRRAAGVVAGSTIAVAAIALAVVPGLDPSTPVPDAAHDPASSMAAYTKDGVTYRAEVLGERLLGAAIGDPGQSTVSFDFVVGEEGLRFSPLCYGPRPDLMVTYAVSGDAVGATGCGTDPDPDPGAGGAAFEAPQEKVLLDWGLEPGDTATLTLRLVSVADVEGATVEDPRAVIGGGVYTDTRATRVVAGAEVPQRIEHEGRVWALRSTYEAVRASEHVRISTGRRGAQEDVLVGVALSGLDSPSEWEIHLDGEVVESGSLGAGVDGASWMPWRTFRQGQVYDLRLDVTDGLTDRTRLAFVDYSPVG